MRQQGIVGIFVLLILALAIAGGAYYLGKIPNEPQVTETQATPDPAANWEEYRNESIGYAIKYPPGWKVYQLKDSPYGSPGWDTRW